MLILYHIKIICILNLSLGIGGVLWQQRDVFIVVLPHLVKGVHIRQISVIVTLQIKVHVCIVDNLLMDHVHTHLRKNMCMVIVNQESLVGVVIVGHLLMVDVPVPLVGTTNIKIK